MYVRTYICMQYVCMNVCTHACRDGMGWVYGCLCVCVCVYGCKLVLYGCVNICIIYACVYIYICIYNTSV